MAVKVSKLWSDTKFQSLSDQAKLLYLYLCTSKDISVVGTLKPNLDVVKIELGMTTEELRTSTKALRNLNYIGVIKVEVLYFIVPDHFNTVPKSESSVLKVQKQLKALPDKLVEHLASLGIKTESKVREFTKPTAEEVAEYALSNGYKISGSEFIKYYDDQSERYGKKGVWVDGRGTQVRDWRAKLRKVWFREENKLKQVKGAPEGYESFHIMVNGKPVFPDSWKNDIPHSKNLAMDIKLKEEFNKK
jgi:hypothetical protein